VTATTASPPAPAEDIPGVTRRHRFSDLYHERTNFQFIKHTKRWAILSGVLILLSFVALFARGLNFGIDFEGGTSWQVRMANGNIARYEGPYQVKHRGANTHPTEGFPIVQAVQLRDAFVYRQRLREVLLGAHHKPGAIRVQEVSTRVEKLRALRRRQEAGHADETLVVPAPQEVIACHRARLPDRTCPVETPIGSYER